VNNWEETYGDLKKRGLIIYLILASIGCFFMSRSFALGIILGGIIVLINFSFLQSTIIKTFQNNPVIKTKKTRLILKSFLRLFLLGAVICGIIKFRFADPIGLAVGLSIIFFTIVSLGISNAWKTRNRRAF
jgi:hypothetical protein